LKSVNDKTCLYLRSSVPYERKKTIIK